MKLIVPSKVTARLTTALVRCGNRECGGIIMGEQVEPGTFRVLECSLQRRRGGTAHFVREEDHLDEALGNFLERHGNDYARFNYIGEWHSHPRFSLQPSGQDDSTMRQIVESPESTLTFAVLMLARLGWPCQVQAAASVYEQGIRRMPVEIVRSR